MVKKADLEANIQELVERLDEEVENNANIATARRKLEAELDRSKEDYDDVQQQLDLVGSQYYMYHIQYITVYHSTSQSTLITVHFNNSPV